jgi:pimeloyl-ACP methyl ester carboxylesterase
MVLRFYPLRVAVSPVAKLWRSLSLGMLRYDATAALKAISVPALALAGNKDSVCKPEASERMQRNVPRAQLAKLAPAKHMIEHQNKIRGNSE